MIQWLKGERGRSDGVGRIFFGPGSVPSGTAAEAIAGTIEDDRVWAPDELNSAISTLARIIHGNELHDPAFATESDLDAERQIRFQADLNHRIEHESNIGETVQYPIHGVVVNGYWRDVSAYGGSLNMPVTFAAPSVTLGSTFQSGAAARFTSGNFSVSSRRTIRWGFAFAGDTVYLGIVGFSPASVGGGEGGATGQQSFEGIWSHNTMGLIQYSAAGAQVGADTIWETDNPLETDGQNNNVLQGFIVGSNIYWLMADNIGAGFSLAAYNLSTGAYQASLSGNQTRFSGAPGAIRGAWGTATRQFLCFQNGQIREYNPATGAFVRLFATLPAGSISSVVYASGRLRGDATHLYVLTGSSASTVGFLAYDLATGMLDADLGLTSFGLTSSADLWDFNVKPGVAELYYSTLPSAYPPSGSGRRPEGYVSAQRSAKYGLPTSGLVLERSDNLPDVVIPGLPSVGQRDTSFVEAVYQALLRGDTPGDGKTVSYDPIMNAIALNIAQGALPGLRFALTTSGNDIQVDWSVSRFAQTAGRFTLRNVVGSGQTGSATFLGLTDVTENDYTGHGGQIVAVNSGATGLEFVAAATGTFLGLTDVTETTFTGHGGQFIKVNAGATGLEFAASETLGLFGGTPSAVGSVGSAGTGGTAARGDHVHQGLQLAETTTPVNTTTAKVGVSGLAARADHDHGVVGGTAGVSVTSTVTPRNTPGTASIGSSDEAARADHDHGIAGGGRQGVTLTYSTANPPNTPGSPSPGSATSVARSDHNHGVTPGITSVRRNSSLTGNGAGTALGLRIPLDPTVVRAIFNAMRGTSPLAVTHNVSAARIGFDAMTLVSRIAALEAAAMRAGWTL